MDKIKNLRDVYYTLDKISVSGEENCSRIVGCRQVLAQVINAMEQEVSPLRQPSAATSPKGEARDGGTAAPALADVNLPPAGSLDQIRSATPKGEARDGNTAADTEREQEAANVCKTDLPGEPQDADA